MKLETTQVLLVNAVPVAVVLDSDQAADVLAHFKAKFRNLPDVTIRYVDVATVGVQNRRLIDAWV